MAGRVVYLHGFASSADSTKASYLGARFRDRGVRFQCPDLNDPDFRTLTISRMLGVVDRQLSAAADVPVTVVGSSLGGAVAILAAAREPRRIDRLVLLAPAVMFGKPGHHLLPPERIEEWRRKGALPFFHYGANEERLLNFGFYEDSLRHNAFEASFAQSALVFQGQHDQSVDPRTVHEFSRARSNTTFTRLDDDHQLTASLPRIWSDIAVFLELE